MWQPADPVPKFCPEVIRKYLSIKGTQHPALSVNVRRHLKHLGWTIEYSSSNGVFRYTSPLTFLSAKSVENWEIQSMMFHLKFPTIKL